MSGLFCSVCLITNYGCKQNISENQTQKISGNEVGTKLIEEDNLAGLYSHYSTEPQNQYEKDKNTIIDFASSVHPDGQFTESGLFYKIVIQGSGKKFSYGNDVMVYYKGYFTDGNIFDSNIGHRKPYKFKLGQVIHGWNEGLHLLSPGSKAVLMIPSHLGYGNEGLPEKIPPNSVLIFEIETIL
ncbi:MAG: FKBP-type peptidyl-prolyl cis-trans isomerase [Saprospiraceae bacterium]|nr:FKBP-type peptidyl-prolyl cis-trans isomerase [Saprospiraceae bacterium]